jgi:hypothetical protein
MTIGCTGSGATVAAELAKNRMLVNGGRRAGESRGGYAGTEMASARCTVPVQQRAPAGQCSSRDQTNGLAA